MQEYWYLSRTAGFTAYVVMFASVAAGIVTTTKLASRLRLGNLPFDLHRFLSLLALGLTLLHVFVLLGDSYMNYTVAELWVPFASPYRPFAVALGVIGAWLMIAIVASFYLRRYIGQRAWRTLHCATFGLYAMATAHGLLAGTDAGTWWARDVYLATVAGVLLLTGYRLNHATGGRTPAATQQVVGAISTGAGFAVSMIVGALVGTAIVSLSGA